MNIKDIDALKKEGHQEYACTCAKNKNKPLTFVCVACGKCYHASCIFKVKIAYHLTGNLICCCEPPTSDDLYYEQEIALLKLSLSSAKLLANNYEKQNKSLLDEINDLHRKYNDDKHLTQSKQELLEKVKHR